MAAPGQTDAGQAPPEPDPPSCCSSSWPLPGQLRHRLMPEGEQEFLQAALLPLLVSKHSAPACLLLWAVARELPALTQALGGVARQQHLQEVEAGSTSDV